MKISARNALDLWRGAVTETVRSRGPDLTARQLAIMLCVYLTEPPHTVRGLATDLKLRKPAVTRALDKLEQLGFARRKSDPDDARSILVQRTVRGSVYLSDFGDLVVRTARQIS
ncbi:MAG TPA: MarR family transcriptional regulator [Alphaproteobacteria bacterium]|nr:MarR family transcriptional regulator [Alphaproteobacteria bacterium]